VQQRKQVVIALCHARVTVTLTVHVRVAKVATTDKLFAREICVCVCSLLGGMSDNASDAGDEHDVQPPAPDVDIEVHGSVHEKYTFALGGEDEVGTPASGADLLVRMRNRNTNTQTFATAPVIVRGSVRELKVEGPTSVIVHGSVEKVKTQSGDVYVKGAVTGRFNSVLGDMYVQHGAAPATTTTAAAAHGKRAREQEH
jgi:hypothetical protein